MTAPFEHADEVRQALSSIVADPGLGPDSLNNSQTAANILRDLLPDAPREVSLLLAAISAGAPAMLREHIAQGMDGGTAISLIAATLASRTAFALSACQWVATELAVALSLVPAASMPPRLAADIGPDSSAPPARDPTITAGALAQRGQHTSVLVPSQSEPVSSRPRPRAARAALLSAIGLVLAAAAGGALYAAGLPASRPHHRGVPAPPHPGTTATPLVSAPPDNAWIAQLASASLRASSAALDSVLARVRLNVPHAQVLKSDAYASLRPGYWVIYYPGPFRTGAQALAYCAAHGRAGRDLCIGRYLSNNPADFGYQCYPPAASPSGNCTHRTVASPVAVVEAYIAAVNRHNWVRAWALGGKNLGQSYSQLIAGYAHTSHVQITSITATGSAVTVVTRATETDGTTQRYRLSYQVSNGTITAGQSVLVSG